MSGFDAEKLCPSNGHGSVFTTRCICSTLQRAYAAGIEAAAAHIESATLTITKMGGWTISGSLASPINIGSACADEIRALLPKPEKEAGP